MNGLLVIKKEKNMTSHDVINKLRRILNTKKIGHLGTLDPLATGVLVVCVGEATKLAQFIENVDKTYIAEVCLGKSTSTMDEEGEVIEEKSINSIDLENLKNTLNSFLGLSKQIPPIYSAIKVNGMKLYDYARSGKEVDIIARDIEIKDINLLNEPVFKNNKCYFKIETTVSKGTYIRSLCNDIGRKLGVPSYMSDLIRTKNGVFSINEAYSLEDVAIGNFKFINMIDSLGNLPKTNDENLISKAKNGMKISKNNINDIFNFLPNQLAIYKDDKLYAIYQIDELCYKAVRVWN